MSTFTIFLILILIVSVLLMLVIMVQNPKGGGLSSSLGGGSSQVVGNDKKTGDFLDKSTWTLATLLIVLILLSNVALKGNYAGADSKLLDTEINTAAPEVLLEEAVEVPVETLEVPAKSEDTQE